MGRLMIVWCFFVYTYDKRVLSLVKMVWLRMLMKRNIKKNIMILKIHDIFWIRLYRPWSNHDICFWYTFIAFQVDIFKLLKVIAYPKIINVDLTATNETKITLVSFSGVCCEWKLCLHFLMGYVLKLTLILFHTYIQFFL